MTVGGVTAAKAALRAELRRDLAGVPDAELRSASTRVRAELLALPVVREAERLLVCLSFGREVDTWALVEELVARSVAVAVPRADRGDPRLHLHAHPCRLVTLSWGLRQPSRREPELSEAEVARIDAAVIPGLGFDPRSGRRLGYGGGYFDRFLARTGVPGIGICLARQLREDLPAEPHDVPMRWIVSEAGVLGPFARREPAGRSA